MDKYKNYFFCNLDFGTQLTGVERAALKRAKVFKSNFGIDVIFLTSRFNIDIHKNIQTLKKLGWMPNGSEVYNVYEYYRGYYKHQFDKINSNYFDLNRYNVIDIESNALHQKYTSKVNDKFFKYVVWSDVAKTRLSFINNIFNGKITKREKFDNEGRLFAIQDLDDNGKVVIEDLIHVDGHLVLQRYFGENNKLMKIVLFDRDGSIIDVFFNEEQLVDYWIKDIVDITEPQCFIIDRNTNWNIALKNFNKNTGHLSISLVHSSHMVELADNILTGPLNSNFKGVLEDKYIVDHIVTLTPQQKSDIETRFKNKKNIVSIPHSIDILPKQVDFKQRNSNKIVAMCRLAPEKQVVDMVLMMGELVKSHPNLKLHIYGDGGEKNKIIEKIAELKLQENIILEGYTDDISLAYQDAIFSLLTSRCEGFSLAILESLTFGVPAASYDIPYGPASMITDGVNGVLVKLGDYKAMAEGLSRILSDENQLKEMSAQAYLSTENYLEHNVAKSWEKLIQCD